MKVPPRVVERGMVCLTMGVHARALLVDAPRVHDHVAIRRVPMPRVVDDSVRADKGTTMMAVVEAVLVVEKRWRLREESPFRTQRIETHQPQRITRWSELERRHRG